MKNVTFVISTLSHGGSERVVSLLANNLCKTNNVSIVLVGNEENKFYHIEDMVKVISLDAMRPSKNKLGAIINNLMRLIRLRNAIKKSRPDLVISFLFATNVLVLIACLFLRLKIIISERNDPDNYKESSRIWNVLRKFTYPLAYALVVQNKNILKKLERYCKNTTIIANPLVNQNVKYQLTKDNSVIQLLAMGSLSEQKGFDTLIKSFQKSYQKNNSLRLRIIGEGHLRKNLENLLIKLNLENVVELPGLCPNPPDEFNRSDIFILSSRFEGSPNALLEAMTFGLPCISTDCPSGPSEIIRNDKNGILIPVDDIDTLSEKIDYLAANKEVRDNLKIESRKIKNLFDVNKISKEWVSL